MSVHKADVGGISPMKLKNGGISPTNVEKNGGISPTNVENNGGSSSAFVKTNVSHCKADRFK